MDPSSKQSIDYYFDSYAHFSIHEDMLKDRVRTLSYKSAIQSNPSLFIDKVVLDVGCGTGILSMFAIKAGAKHVYAVEKSSIVDSAREIIKVNGYENCITIIQGTMEEIELPEKVDVIISEWMGYCLFYESMLPSVISARDRFMKPGGTMFPNIARVFLTGIEDSEYRSQKIGFWDNVYGFSFDPIKKWALLEPLVETCPSERIITNECMILELDLNKCSAEDLSFNVPFRLIPNDEEKMHALVAWFDVEFKGPDASIVLSTSPYKKSTHWSQTIFYLEKPVGLGIETTVQGTFDMRPNPKNPRDQDFVITFKVEDQEYSQFYKMR